MKRRMRLVLAAAVLLAGCSDRSVMEKVMPPGADRFARDFIQLAAAGDTARAMAMLEPTARGARSEQGLAMFRATLGGKQPGTLAAVNYARANSDGRLFYTAAYEARLGSGWMLFEVLFTRLQPGGATTGSAGSFAVVSVSATPLKESLREANAFTLRGKSGAHYLILLFGLASLLFSLYTLVQVIRTPDVRRWAWAIACLVSAGSLRLNWTTGEAHFFPISVVLLGFSFVREGLIGPWMVQAAFPIGAALFHWRGQFKHPDRAERAPDAGPEPPEEQPPTS